MVALPHALPTAFKRVALLSICILNTLSTAITSNTYVWKNNFKVHYVSKGSSGPPVLLIPGFGVGTFHFSRNIDRLSSECRVFSLDLMGQGKSWPEGSIEKSLQWRYSVENWRDQIIDFLLNVVGEPAHLVGNSLGGYLGTMVAHQQPSLVSSLVLLNPTPFWGFLPQNNTWNVWDGALPAPSSLLRFGSSYFDLMRDPSTIKRMLSTVYSKKDSLDEGLITDIVQAASDRGGHEAFTSILFSPKAPIGFEEMLRGLTLPVCQMNGKEDPWITPFWGRRIKKVIPSSQYLELSPCGHVCTHI